MSVSPAPAPTDIVWENIGASRSEEITWRSTSWILTVLIILFWTIPTTFVASFASVERLQDIPQLADLFAAYPNLKNLAKQISPISLVIMTSLASIIFGILSKREGHASLSQVNASHFSKLVYFQTFQIFFVSVVAGTVWESLNEILNEPRRIISLLGSTLPGQSTTFMSYLIVQVSLALV